MTINFTVPGPPIAKGRPRIARGHAYTPKRTHEYEAKVWQYAQEAADGYRYPPETPLAVTITCYKPIPRSLSKATQQQMEAGELRPVKRTGDLDNLVKGILDGLQDQNDSRRLIPDDAQVAELVAASYYSNEPHTEVTITIIGGIKDD